MTAKTQKQAQESTPDFGLQIGDVKAETRKIDNAVYEKELKRLQVELVKLQEWVKHEGLKVVVVFEGRDAAGKGGVIKRMLVRSGIILIKYWTSLALWPSRRHQH